MQSVQEGGTLLGEGVYGCVFDPPLKCTKPKRLAKERSKLQKAKHAVAAELKRAKHAVAAEPQRAKHQVGKITSVQSAQTEFGASQQLNKAPNADKYFVLIEELCVPEAKAKQQEPDLPKCSFLNNIVLPNQAQITMAFGGAPLRYIPRLPSRLDYYKIGQHLLEAGTLMLMQGIVHRDLHPMNILVDSPKTCRIIDFGMSYRPDLLTLSNLQQNRMFLQFSPEFSQEPPEVTYGNGIRYNVPEPIIFARIFDKKRELALVQTVLGISKQAQINRLKGFLNQSKSVQEQNAFAFFKVYWSKTDAWAIGAVLLTLWTDFLYEPSFEQQPVYQTKKQTILKVIKGLMDCDAARRFDCAEALAIWAPDSPLLQQANVKVWLKEQAAIRAAL